MSPDRNQHTIQSEGFSLSIARRRRRSPGLWIFPTIVLSTLPISAVAAPLQRSSRNPRKSNDDLIIPVLMTDSWSLELPLQNHPIHVRSGVKKWTTFSPLQSKISPGTGISSFFGTTSQRRWISRVRNNCDHWGCCVWMSSILMDDNIMTDEDFHDDGSLPGGALLGN